jgi:hypothetical protein
MLGINQAKRRNKERERENSELIERNRKNRRLLFIHKGQKLFIQVEVAFNASNNI